MRNRIPHNILTLSDFSGRTGKLTAEVIALDELKLTAGMVKKLRGSSSRSNKSIYIRIFIDGVHYNVAHVARKSDGSVRIMLISPNSQAVIEGKENEPARLVEIRKC